MRPGRNAPDNRIWSRVPETRSNASMRPGRNAPDNVATDSDQGGGTGGFNEAGAKCPG